LSYNKNGKLCRPSRVVTPWFSILQNTGKIFCKRDIETFSTNSGRNKYVKSKKITLCNFFFRWQCVKEFWECLGEAIFMASEQPY
jgi:hypothetical protein